MFEVIIQSAGNLIHCTFIPVVHAAQNESKTNENAWDRIINTFSSNEYGAPSSQIGNITSIIQNGFFFGIVMGGAVHSKNQYMDFMENTSASKYKWHHDAKAALNNQLVKAAIRGAYAWGKKCLAVTTTFAVLLNYIPVLRNEHGWLEYVSSGLITGAMTGHLFSDREGLGFQVTKHNSRFSYKQLCLIRGTGYGLILSLLMGANANISNIQLQIAELRKWEKYWKQRREGQENGTDKAARD